MRCCACPRRSRTAKSAPSRRCEFVHLQLHSGCSEARRYCGRAVCQDLALRTGLDDRGTWGIICAYRSAACMPRLVRTRRTAFILSPFLAGAGRAIGAGAAWRLMLTGYSYDMIGQRPTFCWGTPLLRAGASHRALRIRSEESTCAAKCWRRMQGPNLVALGLQ